jgi:DNA-binding FadR family transcriptional regulator
MPGASDQFMRDQSSSPRRGGGDSLSKNEIVTDLERRILAGEFVSSGQLPSSRELGDEYGVSRPVIREALSGIVERGLVVVRPGRGTFVREFAMDQLSEPLTRAAHRTGATARQLVVARVMLESEAAALAAMQIDRPVDAIDAALRAHDEATSLVTHADTDLAFHETIIAACGNPLIELMFGAIRGHVRSLMLRSHSDREVRRLGLPFHQTIAKAIRDGDPVAARRAMEEHLHLALELFGRDLDRPLSDIVPDRY